MKWIRCTVRNIKQRDEWNHVHCQNIEEEDEKVSIQLLYGSYSAPDSSHTASLRFWQCTWFLSYSFFSVLTVHLILLIQLLYVSYRAPDSSHPALYGSDSAPDSFHPASLWFLQCTWFLSTSFFKFPTVHLIPLIQLLYVSYRAPDSPHPALYGSDSAPDSSHSASLCFPQCIWFLSSCLFLFLTVHPVPLNLFL